MIDQLKTLLGISELPYFGDQILLVFSLVLIFFGALAFLNAVLNIIFGFLPGKD